MLGAIRGGVIGRAGVIRMMTRRDGRIFTRLCMAVLALCLLHHLLMATLGHALVMGPSHDGGMIAPHVQPIMLLDARDPGTAAGHQMPSLPLPLLGDCPAQQAVFPLLMVADAATRAGPASGRAGKVRVRHTPCTLIPAGAYPAHVTSATSRSAPGVHHLIPVSHQRIPLTDRHAPACRVREHGRR